MKRRRLIDIFKLAVEVVESGRVYITAVKTDCMHEIMANRVKLRGIYSLYIIP